MNYLDEEFMQQVARRKKLENELHLIKDENHREKRRIELEVLRIIQEEIIEEERQLAIFKAKPEVFKFYLNMKKLENKN
jgi:hypothetical protein